MKLIFLVLAASLGIAEASPPNWSGKYAPCNRHFDVLNREHMNLGVKFSTSNTALARQFALAMEFWTGVLDLEWHDVDSQDCSIQLVDGTPELFNSANTCRCVSARAQLPDLPAFQGWIAFNPSLKLNEHEMFLTSVHEIGHLLGLGARRSADGRNGVRTPRGSRPIVEECTRPVCTSCLTPRSDPLTRPNVSHPRCLRESGSLESVSTGRQSQPLHEVGPGI